MQERTIVGHGIRFSVEKDGREVGRAYLYLLKNDLHSVPFGLLEDVYVDEQYRGQGIANTLVATVMQRAREEQCYKLLATSRNDGTRTGVHDWYVRLGFKAYGTEFRIDLGLQVPLGYLFRVNTSILFIIKLPTKGYPSQRA